MRNRNWLNIIPLLGLLLLCLGMQAQDIHYSQFFNTPQNLSPGLTGIFKGDHRFIINFRNQWQSVPVPYLQFAGAFDTQISNKKGEKTPWTAGAIFNYDRAGDAKLGLAQFGGSFAYTHRLSKEKKHQVTFGLLGSLNQRSFQPNELIFGDQYTIKEGVNVDLQSEEAFVRSSKSFADLGGGINFRFQKNESRTHFDLGFGLFHLFEPEKNFTEEANVKLERRASFYGTANIQGTENFDFQFYGMSQFQGSHQEVLLGLGGLFYLNQQKTQELALQFGGFYRIQDAFILMAGLHYKPWRFMLTYDLNTSGLHQASFRRGGPEISLQYIIIKVPKDKYCKLCPKYM